MAYGTLLDPLLRSADKGLRAVFAPARARREPPFPPAAPLSEAETRQAAGLMRVNHAGEVAAQALYHGQALMARSAQARAFLLRAAEEEGDHLAWCERRLGELNSHTSWLNPLWYAGSFLIGAGAACLGDAISLGFVAETERQVEGHLADHLERLPTADARSRSMVEQMRQDEVAHGQAARQGGAAELPLPVRRLMRCTSRVMTGTAFWV